VRSPVTMKFRVEEDLRTRFKDAAWRSHRHPSQVLRQLMERYAELAEDHHTVDMTVWTNIRRAADGVTRVRKDAWPPPHPGRR
jgi:hypothetical protein